MKHKYDRRKYVEADARWKGKDADYRRKYRHLDYYIQRALAEGECLSMKEFREKLKEETGFRFSPGTLKNYLGRCLADHGVTPLEETYRLNPEYYDSVSIEPSRINRKKRRSPLGGSDSEPVQLHLPFPDWPFKEIMYRGNVIRITRKTLRYF
jgi:hypothetical protein